MIPLKKMADASIVRRRFTCRLCGSRDLDIVLSLTPTPLATAFVTGEIRDRKEPTFPLDIMLCRSCEHAQLADLVDVEGFFADYRDAHGDSPEGRSHFEAYADELMADVKPASDALIVDVGSNDGTFLSVFKDRGRRVQGVDPAIALAREAVADGIATHAGQFTPAVAARIEESRGPAAIVAANQVLAHADDIAGIIEGVDILLARDGVFSLEVPSAAEVVSNAAIDLIHHGNLDYHSVASLNRFLDGCGMEIIAAARTRSLGRRLRVLAQRKGGPRKGDGSLERLLAEEQALRLGDGGTWERLKQRIDTARSALAAKIDRIKRSGLRLVGIGASCGAITMLYHFRLDASVLDFIVDDNTRKQGFMTAGFHLPVLSSEALVERQSERAIVLKRMAADEVTACYSTFSAAGGRFILPIPDVIEF
jgi:predicted TPR repeat methyltransferase